MNDSLYDIPLKRLDGSPTTLRDFAGQALLIVNVASKCGLTPQYAGLETLFRQYRARGLQVLGFPCNDFAQQEPGSADDIQQFCTTNYGIEFPMFEKVNINSAPRHPLYAQLIADHPVTLFPAGSDFQEKLAGFGIKQAHPTDVLWNFEKFLIGRNGEVIQRFSPDTNPDEPGLIAAIEAALA